MPAKGERRCVRVGGAANSFNLMTIILEPPEFLSDRASRHVRLPWMKQNRGRLLLAVMAASSLVIWIASCDDGDGAPGGSCRGPGAIQCVDYRGSAAEVERARVASCGPDNWSSSACDRAGALGACSITFTSSRGALQTIAWIWPGQTIKTVADAQAECDRRDQDFVPVGGPLPPLPPE
jgi:hypothetical protein